MNIAFDLDGTLTDSYQGVAKSINYALAHFGRDAHPVEHLRKYVGPSLKDTFTELLGDGAMVDEAVFKFRERYFQTGYKENKPYPGIRSMLEALRSMGAALFVATSKRQDIAQTVVEHFAFDTLFERVLGAGMKSQKSDLLFEISRSHPQALNVMVGDRCFDVDAAKTAGFSSIGVLWGYGPRDELTRHGAEKLVDSPGEIIAIVRQWAITPPVPGHPVTGRAGG